MAVKINNGFIRIGFARAPINEIDYESIKSDLILKLLHQLDADAGDYSTKVIRASLVEQTSKWKPDGLLNNQCKVLVHTVLYVDRYNESHLNQTYYNTPIKIKEA